MAQNFKTRLLKEMQAALSHDHTKRCALAHNAWQIMGWSSAAGICVEQAAASADPKLGGLHAVMSCEIGGGNGLEPLAIGAHMGLPVVDADFMGRAFPELQVLPGS